MAEVLSVPREPNGQSYYSSQSSLKRSSPSQISLPAAASSSYSSARRTSPPGATAEHNEHVSRSLPSSTSTSPRASYTDFSQIPSSSSTPASSISFGSNIEEDDGEEIAFPSYDGVQFFTSDEPLDLPPSPRPDEERIEERIENCEVESATTATTESEEPLPTPTVADDTAIKQEPSRHVDYLSHEWREEDIWSSWRHIVSQRSVYGQRSRLENASWRTWAKTKNHLATVSPETLNWLKESDVTWLYGPLQPAQTHMVTQAASEPASNLSKKGSFATKKPILKKRSMSEVMLQRSISASSLVQQAAASVQAQRTHVLPPRRPMLSRAGSAYVGSTASSEMISRDQLDYFSTRASSSGNDTPNEAAKRHIRFDDKVEQCIAVESKDEEYDDGSDSEDETHHADDSDSDSSDDGLVMMKRARKKRPALKPSSRTNSTGRTIEKLPATTLKYRKDSIEPSEQPQSPFGRSWSSSKLSPSPSSETLRPSHPSRNFLLYDDDDDEDEDDIDSQWASSGAFANRRDSVSVTKARSMSIPSDESSASTSDIGLRRTPSGMFMPYEEDEDDIVAAGLFGKVSDTINTAKDIAHVIWNVGWRK